MEKLKEVDWRGIYKTATQKVKKYTLNLTDLELKVEEATNSETWGPHGSVMNEIADAAFDPENYRQIMGVLARRLQERDDNWRMCYKALLLLEHLIKHGPGKVVGDVQSSASVLDRLQHFEYKDANLRDHGVNVRHRAKEILQLVNNPERLREEREKAKANRSKYRGVSADQMRSGGFSSASSFGRSTSDHYSSTTSGSLFPAGGGGGLGGGGSLGGGFGGGSSSYAGMSRRTDSYDETEEGAHYISKRSPGGSSAGLDPVDGGSSGVQDAVAATKARIERLKIEEKPSAEESKKKLTDVRVNPKIAASLGLKIPTQPPTAPPAPAATPASSSQAGAAASAGELDLLGGLTDEPAVLSEQSTAPAPVAAAAPAAVAAPFDPFAAAPPAPAASSSAQQQGWDAFGSAAAPASSAPPASASVAAPAAAPLDMLGGLDFGAPAPSAAAVIQQPHAASADPFAAFTAPPAVAPQTLPGAPAALLAATKPAAAAALPAVAAGVPAALPEDMFADLTGINSRPQQPMGQGSHPPPAASASAPAAGGMGGAGSAGAGMDGGMGWGLPTASPPSPGSAFGTFAGGAPAPLAAATPSSMQGLSSGGMGMGVGGPNGGQLLPQGPIHGHGHGRSGSVNSSVDFGSLSYSSGQQGGASAADPFADLLK